MVLVQLRWSGVRVRRAPQRGDDRLGELLRVARWTVMMFLVFVSDCGRKRCWVAR